ncbi:hypothetical protein IMPERIA89_80061 [Imperialibacter sp. 89]|nr:hypothetical protein IMPERIA89_80061 [Imperialibacter sp. 89]CAD5299854.1 hypothetical protein IMPERIA75_90061 [Imperialibacter sp. 75]
MTLPNTYTSIYSGEIPFYDYGHMIQKKKPTPVGPRRAGMDSKLINQIDSRRWSANDFFNEDFTLKQNSSYMYYTLFRFQ